MRLVIPSIGLLVLGATTYYYYTLNGIPRPYSDPNKLGGKPRYANVKQMTAVSIMERGFMPL